MSPWIRTIVVVLWFLPVCSLAFSSQEQAEIKSRIEVAMTELDLVQIYSTDEFILTMYQQVLKKEPSEMELFTTQLLLDGIGLEHPIERSHFVEQLLVLKSGGDELSWEFLAENLDMIESLDPARSPSIGVYEVREEDVRASDRRKFLKPLRNDDKYRVYHGFLHAHSELSDGRGDAISAYRMAKFEAGLDYFALTDHAELLHFWPWDKKYKQLIKASNRFDEKGVFAALYGFEWSHPVLGHFNVVNTQSYTSAILSPTMGMLMRWLSKKDGTFGRFNHPGRHDIGRWPREFMKLKVYNHALHHVVGIEMWNKNDGIDHYLYKQKSFKKRFNYLDNANLNGWFVGAVGGQDNHGADWGLRNDYRVGVWSKGLSRQKIVDSYFARRTFATEDKNAWMSFKLNGAEMGSRLRAGRLNMELTFGDDNAERIAKARLVRNGEQLMELSVPNRKKQRVTAQLSGAVGQFFYVIAEQEDGDLLLSSPIWIVP